MGHTPWLDDDEQRTWRAFLAANRLVSERVERQMQNESGMPQAYYEILVRLSEAPGRQAADERARDVVAVVAQPGLARGGADGGDRLDRPHVVPDGPARPARRSSPTRAWRCWRAPRPGTCGRCGR